MPKVFPYPVRNRGPGQMTNEEAGTARQKISQLTVVNKKRKVAVITATNQAKQAIEIGKVLAGDAATTGTYVSARHDLSPKGLPIHGDIMPTVQAIYNGSQPACEAAAKVAMPKYNIGGAYPSGVNLSPATLNPTQALRFALKDQMAGQIDNDRGQKSKWMDSDGIDILQTGWCSMQCSKYQSLWNFTGGSNPSGS